MSKNFVREIDGIYNINKQDFNTNKPNDLLSTRAQNYIRTENRGYHCLTDNVKATRAKNVTYKGKQLIAIDNADVPTTNENTLNGQQLVSVINEMATEIETLENELASLNEKQPLFHYVAEFAGGQLFNMETTQTYNFSNIEIFSRISYSVNIPSNKTRNFAEVLESGATNFDFNDYNIMLANFYKISGNDGIEVSIDGSGKGLDFTTLRDTEEGFFSGEIICKFKLTKKQQTVAE